MGNKVPVLLDPSETPGRIQNTLRRHKDRGSVTIRLEGQTNGVVKKTGNDIERNKQPLFLIIVKLGVQKTA